MDRWIKVVLSAGWLLLGVGALVAHRTPARGYELSIYGATPIGFWIAVALAVVVAVGTVLSPSKRTAAIGGSLGVGTISTVLFLPVIRGYYYVSIGDPLTHLGYTRDLLQDQFWTGAIPYPGLHLFGIAISELGGVDPRTGLLLGSLGIVATFLLTLPLLVRELTSSPAAVRCALLVGLLLLPINSVSVHPRPHPFTQMVFFSPVFLYALVGVKRSNRVEWIGLFVVIATAIVVYHPQVSLAVGLFTFIVAAVDYVSTRRTSGTAPARTERTSILSLSLAFIVLTVTYVLDLLVGLLSSLVYRVFVEPQGAVQERTAAASELGVDPTELLLRTAGPQIVSSLLAVIALGAWVRDRDGPWIGYFAVGSLAFAGIGGLYVAAGQINQFTRYGSLGLVIVAVFAAIGIAYVDEWSRPHFGRSTVRTAAAVAFCLLLLASVPTMFIGPYTERPNQHITAAMYEGTETAFEYDDGETPYYGVNVDRFDDAVYGANDDRIGNDERIGDTGELDYEFGPDSRTAELDDDRYLLLTTYQYEQDVTVHDGLRNSESDYEGLNHDSNVDRLSSGEETTLYRVSPAEGE